MATKGGRPRKKSGQKTPAITLNVWYWAALAGLMLLLFYPSYFRGLFFPVEQLWTLLLAGVVWGLVWGWKISRRGPSFLTSPWDYLALALVAVYALTVWGAASQDLAMNEVVKVSLYFLVFWMVAQVSRVERALPWLLLTIYASAVGVAAAGYFTAVGLIDIKDGFTGGQFSSTLQYHNALATMLVAASFIGYYLWGRADRRLFRLICAAGNYLLLLIFLGSGSRGGYLVYPVTLVLFFIGLPASWRWRTLAHLVIVAAGALLVNKSLVPSILAGEMAAAWGWLVAGLAGIVVAHLAWEVGGKFLHRRQVVWIGVAAVILVVAIILGWGWSAGPQEQSLLARLVPEQMLARLQDINLETRSVAERLVFMREALSFGAQRPVLGHGGGAWEAAYRSFQSYPYTSTQVHNHYGQVWTEVGLAGTAIWLGLWLLFLWVGWQNYSRSVGSEKARQWAVGVAGISLGLHAFIDFDLSLGAISLVLWSLWGITRGRAAARLEEGVSLSPKEFARFNPRCWWLAAGGAAVVILLATTLLLGNYYSRQAVAAAGRGDAVGATAAFRLAATFDPWNGSYLIDLASLLQEEEPAVALQLAQRATQKEPYNAAILTRLGEIAWRQGEWDLAVEVMERARAANRWSVTGLENSCRMAALAGVNYLGQGDKATSRKYLEQAVALPGQMLEQQAAISPETRRLWEMSGRPFFEATPVLKLSQGIAHYLLGNGEEAATLLQAAAADAGTRAEALLWLAVLRQQEGDAAAAAELRSQVAELDPAQARNFDFLAGLSVLQPRGVGPENRGER